MSTNKQKPYILANGERIYLEDIYNLSIHQLVIGEKKSPFIWCLAITYKSDYYRNDRNPYFTTYLYADSILFTQYGKNLLSRLENLFQCKNIQSFLKRAL